ncbi:MAG: SMC family ATPase [Ardenticatenia bacterium]|nr:SMC family ATPase [Ardenticatenia bacterium]
MIPLRLVLRNFMSYRGEHNEVDFSQLHVASLVGDNGHGKSALLDAITWALWGKSRARRDDDLITWGEDEAEVRFEFELNDQRYRVIRRRTRAGRGGRGQTLLELQLHNGTLFIPISGNNLRETQAKINALLRVDYDTFINSAFILQGRADEFTTKRPGKRKEILADILGLDVYDAYEQRARDKAKEAEGQVEFLRRELEEIEREAATIEEREKAVEKAEHAVRDARQALEAAEANLRRVRDQLRKLEARDEERLRVERRIQELHAELQKLSRRQQALEAGLQEHQALLHRAEEIESAYHQLQEARRELEHWNRKMRELLDLQEERRDVQRHIDEARHRLERELHHKEQVVAQCQAELARVQEIVARREALERRRAELDDLVHRLAALRAARDAAQEERGELIAENNRLRQEMEQLKERIQLLEEEHDAMCPVCRQPLSDQRRQQLLADIRAEGTALGDRYRHNWERLQALKAELEAHENAVKELEAQLHVKRPQLDRELARLEQRLEQAEAVRRRQQQARADVDALRRRLDRRDYAHEAHARLAQLDEEAHNLGYDRRAHDDAERRARDLEPAEEAWNRLRVAREQIARDREALEDVSARLRRAREEQAELERRRARLLLELEGGHTLRRQEEELRRTVTHLEGELAAAQVRLGSAQQRLEYARRQAEKQEAKRRELHRWQERLWAFQALQEAFGKRGLQAMIIEAVLPEIEDEANRLLGMMTDGRMYVRLETQRETQRGTVVETLDIIIGDEHGARPYELYSGGEAFRVNFALRIAMSKLLARRAGARLQTLFIDEGFGSQDRTGRERLIAAINAIQDEFARILVITHIEELKDAFPARIDVVKDERGSRVHVTA